MNTSQLSFSLFGEPRPNELVWGWLGRFRERYEGVSHDALAEITGELPSYRKLFPTRLEHLAAVGGMTADDLLCKHTCYKFAALEMSASDAASLRSSMLTGNAPVNVPARFAPRSDETLRVCRRCIEDDLATTGDSYYRCLHQIREVCECSKHRVPLISTAVPVGERNYIPPHVAVQKGRDLYPAGYAPALVADAYEYFLGKKVLSRDQVVPVLRGVLETRGYLCDGRVQRNLHGYVSRCHGGRWLWSLGFNHHDAVADWVTVPQLALVLHALSIDFDSFFAEAELITATDQEPAPLTPYQQELLNRIRVDARKDARNLRRAGAKVTVWALANALSARYGMNLASNYAWRPEFRAVLLAHTKAF